jgi:hypothetical protein
LNGVNPIQLAKDEWMNKNMGMIWMIGRLPQLNDPELDFAA